MFMTSCSIILTSSPLPNDSGNLMIQSRNGVVCEQQNSRDSAESLAGEDVTRAGNGVVPEQPNSRDSVVSLAGEYVTWATF